MKKVKTTPIPKGWYNDLKEEGLTADSVFSEWDCEALKHKLLSIGGQAVIFMGKLDEYGELLQNGEFVSGENTKMWKLSAGHCHDNVEYIIRRWPHFKGLTGFALSADGVWRYHSWVFDPVRNCIRETTEPRLMYYGIPY